MACSVKYYPWIIFTYKLSSIEQISQENIIIGKYFMGDKINHYIIIHKHSVKMHIFVHLKFSLF